MHFINIAKSYFLIFLNSINLKLLMTFPNNHTSDTWTLTMLSLKAFCFCVRYAPLNGACKYYLKEYVGSPYIQSLSCWGPKEKFSRIGIRPDILSIVALWYFCCTDQYKLVIIPFVVVINWYFIVCFLLWLL